MTNIPIPEMSLDTITPFSYGEPPYSIVSIDVDFDTMPPTKMNNHEAQDTIAEMLKLSGKTGQIPALQMVARSYWQAIEVNTYIANTKYTAWSYESNSVTTTTTTDYKGSYSLFGEGGQGSVAVDINNSTKIDTTKKTFEKSSFTVPEGVTRMIVTFQLMTDYFYIDVGGATTAKNAGEANSSGIYEPYYFSDPFKQGEENCNYSIGNKEIITVGADLATGVRTISYDIPN